MATRKIRKVKTVSAAAVFAEARRRPGYRQAFDALDDEFAILEELMKARSKSGLSQTEIARRMNTPPSVVSRLEAGSHRASLATLRSYARATGHRLKISLEPDQPKGDPRKRRAAI